MAVTSATNTVTAPPKPRQPERNRAQEYRAEQEQQQQRTQRQEEPKKKEPVVNTQGQATGRLLNVSA
jgi:hypothetical protein